MRKIILFCTLLAFLAACSPSEQPQWRKSSGSVWNTLYSITYRADRQLDDSIVAVMKAVELSLSPFNPVSVISQINRGEDVAVDSMIERVFAAAARVSELSDGMYDPTVAPLVNYWGFGYAKGNKENQESLDSILALVGMAECRIENHHIIKKNPNTEFNFSSITKGFGCDAIGDMFRRNGCSDFLIEIGGELSMSGKSPRGSDWTVMVDAPTECTDSIMHSEMMTLTLTDCGVATSGNYRNYRITDRGKVSHTINPRTGLPVTLEQSERDTIVLSATVVAPNAMLADALATASMLLPPAHSAQMVRQCGGTRLILAVSTPADSLLLLTR